MESKLLEIRQKLSVRVTIPTLTVWSSTSLGVSY
jgi:hypothetical protein